MRKQWQGVDPRWVSATQVANRYSVTVDTVFNWLRAGIIPAKVAVGRVYRFDLEEVQVALERHAAERTGAAGSNRSNQPKPEGTE